MSSMPRMTTDQFKQIESEAGGINASNRAFIRAARLGLSAHGKSRITRHFRHAWLRSGLAKRDRARNLFA